LSLSGHVSDGWAALSPVEKRDFIRQGVLTGGSAAEEFTLISIRTEARREGGERWIFQYGDRFGKPVQDRPGFLHVAVDRDSRRVALDFAQVNRAGFGKEALSKITSSSSVVSDSEIIMDPYDHSTNITLSLKKRSGIRLSTEGSEKGQLTLEIVPISDEGKKL
jgi:hypothetical protein